MGACGRNLQAVSGGDGALRVERHGSDHACLPHGARGDEAGQNLEVRGLVSRAARYGAGKREAQGRRVRGHQRADVGSRRLGRLGVKPDMICLAKSIGGGTSLGVFGASRAVMDLISQHKVFHGGTYNTNRISMAAGLATFREVLTRASYAHVGKLSTKLTEGYRRIVAKGGLQAYGGRAGGNGGLML